MKYKKGFIFICLIICLFTIAGVCASDDNETMVMSDSQYDGEMDATVENILSSSVRINETIVENDDLNDGRIAKNLDDEGVDESSDGGDEVSFSSESNDVLGALPYTAYSVSVSNTTIHYGTDGSIKMSISHASSSNDYKYDFYLKVYDSNGNEVISKRDYGSSTNPTSSKYYNVGTSQFNPGIYTIKIINYYDGHIMDTAKLYIISVPYSAYSVRVSDTTINYGYSGSIKMSISPASSSNDYKYDFYLKVYNSSGDEVISQRYYGSSTGSTSSRTYSVGSSQFDSGIYTIKIINYYDGHVMDTAKLYIISVPYSAYSVRVSDTTIKYGASDTIEMSISPASSSNIYKYDFYLKVYNSSGDEIISKRYYSSSSASSKTYSVDSSQFKPGSYTIKIVNTFDDYVMDTANLTLKSVPYSAYSVRVSDTTINFGSGVRIEMSISPASYSNIYRYDFYLKVYNSSGDKVISKRYYSSSSASSETYSSSSYQLKRGIYTIKIVNTFDDYVMDTAKLYIISVPYSAYSVSVSDTTIHYGSTGSIKMSISPAASSSYDYKYDFYLKVYNSSGDEVISQRYYSSSSASSKTYSVGSSQFNPGIYTIKILNNVDDYVMDTAKLTVRKINIQYFGIIGNCTGDIQYKVRIKDDDKYASGLEVIFTCNGTEYKATTDNQGYASFKTHLKAGTYDITTKCEGISNKNTIKVNPVYVENDYKNVHVDSMNGYYNGKNKINYGFTGNLKCYFKIYKGNKLLFEKELNTNGYVSDYITNANHNYYYEGSAINAVGTYKAVITDVKGNVLAQATIKINKAPTHTVCYSFSTLIGSKETIYAGIFDVAEKKIYDTSGKVKFKIAGKTYIVKFKKGFAYLNIKLPLKAKKYKCSVKFLGNDNYGASYKKFNIKLSNKNVVILKKNRVVKVGKFVIKLSPKQYKSLVKAFNKEKSKSIKLTTKYSYKVKVPYTKKIKEYTTTKACKTIYRDYYLMTQKMENEGWTLVSEYTYDVENPKNKHGVGLSAYTQAVCKWVKVSYQTAYKIKNYPVKAKIVCIKGYPPYIEVYSDGNTNFKYLAFE